MIALQSTLDNSLTMDQILINKPYHIEDHLLDTHMNTMAGDEVSPAHCVFHPSWETKKSATSLNMGEIIKLITTNIAIMDRSVCNYSLH